MKKTLLFSVLVFSMQGLYAMEASSSSFEEDTDATDRYTIQNIGEYKLGKKNACFSEDSRFLASKKSNGKVKKVIDIENREIYKGRDHFAPDVSKNPFYISRIDDNTIAIINSKTGKRIARYNRGIYTTCRISPDGRFLASWKDGSTKIVILDRTTKNKLDFYGFDRYLTGLCFSPDSRMLTVGDTQNISIINPVNGNKITDYKQHEPKLKLEYASPLKRLFSFFFDAKSVTFRYSSLHFSPDSRLFASVGADGKAKIKKIVLEKE